MTDRLLLRVNRACGVGCVEEVPRRALGLVRLGEVVCEQTVRLRQLVPAESLVVDPVTGNVSRVTPAAISLIDAEGKTRDDVSFRAGGQSILVTLPDHLPRGTQVISYRVVSEDGHPVAGSLMFSVGAVTRGAAAPAEGGVVAALIWLARIGVYLGLFVGVGGVFFAAWIGCGPDGGRIILGALGVGMVSAVASLGLQGLDLQNLPLTALLTLAPWRSAFATSFGPSLLIAIAAMAIARFAWRSPTMTIAWVLTALAMAGAGLSLATSGHAGMEGHSNCRTLEELFDNLDPNLFWRAHRSFLVNINHIREVVPWFKSSYQLRMDDKKQSEIPVSRAQTKRLRELFGL